jgi:glutamyl-Q tRNA(Asp) synthetase
MPATFRFAPSPNGYLHLGHAFSALLNAALACRYGGKLLLRIEDIDEERSRASFISAIIEDLTWLGIPFDPDWQRQSSQIYAYQQALNMLANQGLIYPCFCTRSDLARTHTTAHTPEKDPDGTPLYPGTCREMPESERRHRQDLGLPYALRLAMTKALTLCGTLPISDFDPLSGALTQRRANPQDWGDVILKRKGMSGSYHLSVVVDDARQNVTHIVRGQDLERATDLHVLLQNCLGLTSPCYYHHTLIKDEAGCKLSKSEGAAALRHWREKGATAEDIRRLLMPHSELLCDKVL